MADGPSHASGRLEAGTELNDTYAIEALLAAGGMGEVYRGRNLATDETVAIKVILPEFAGDPTFMRLFLREAETLSRLTHDAIVRSHVMSIDRRLNRAYFAMEYVTGRSLKEIAVERPLSPGAVRRLLLRLAGGLDVAHRAGIVHRDIAPDNVILPEDDVDRAKLIDFGIAKSARPGDKTILGGSFAGKYNFVSPEQLGRFGGDVTAKSDIYSLALVAVAALRGRPIPMDGSDYERLEKRSAVPDLADVPQPLRALLAAMLQPDPADRPADMATICGALIDMPGDGAGQAPADRGWHPRKAKGGAAEPDPRRSETDDRPLDRDPSPRSVPAGKPRPAAAQGRRWAVPVLASLAVLCLGALLALRPGWFGPVGAAVETLFASPDPAAPEAGQAGQTPFGLAGTGDAGTDPAGAGDATSVIGPDQRNRDWPGRGEDQAMLGPSPGMRQDDARPAPQLPDRIETPPDPTEAVDDTARFVDYIQGFDGGRCFYAVPAAVSDSSVRIDAYANGTAATEWLLRQFQSRFGIEPDIGLRPVVDRQCAAVEFAADRRKAAIAHAGIALATDVVRSGATLDATVDNLGETNLAILIVDGRGIVQDVSGLARRRGDEARLRLVFDLKENASDRQLMMVMTSKTPIETVLPDLPAAAASVFARLDERLSQKEIPVSVSLRAFRVDR
ncbi:serine/threonine-protein kinase [Jiella mangrovi]|uniref:Protein kinase n=1 Tax=Jiella mangrovi TaxID=2821407 RepID=A0ABS4BLM0_9HYPH|nr:serine/threonine-protein kinase [Jiella mangrovi]MBP0617637.1 protein kinase [Jiella mangrovi]